VLGVAIASVVAVGGLSACSSDSKSATPTSTTFKPPLEVRGDKTWLDWNNQAAARGFTQPANKVAADVAKKIKAGGVKCAGYFDTTFDYIATSYYKVGIPIPVGSGECSGATDADDATENILIEVMDPEKPSGADLVAFKRNLLCKRAKEDGRRPDGSSLFPGIPYVMAKDKTYVIQPDAHSTAREIAKVLGLQAKDMCEGIK
jgi:hypothetical protein